jgi:hypothetical protein
LNEGVQEFRSSEVQKVKGKRQEPVVTNFSFVTPSLPLSLSLSLSLPPSRFRIFTKDGVLQVKT